jgi:hypothetical protein
MRNNELRVEWSRIFTWNEAPKSPDLNFAGIYLWFLETGGRKRVVTVGETHAKSKHVNGRLGEHDEKLHTETLYDVKRITVDIHEVMRDYKVSVEKGLILPGSKNQTKASVAPIVQYYKSSLQVAGGKFLNDEASKDNTETAEAILIKYLMSKFKVGRYDPSNDRYNLFGQIQPGRKKNSGFSLALTYVEKTEWFKDLGEESIPDRSEW